VLANGDIRVSWVPVSDPLGQFYNYEIYSSVTPWGPYSLVTGISVLSTSLYVHTGALGNVQSRYYYMITRFGNTGQFSSKSSDTLRSPFLTVMNIGNGVAQLSWNSLIQPSLPSASPTYTLFREYPVNVFTPIKITPANAYNDTIDICSVIYNYQIRISDQAGCISQSQITGDVFKDKTPPRIPYFDSVSVLENNNAVLSWKPSPNPDADKYFVYIKDLSTGIVTKIDSVPVSLANTYTFVSPLPSMQTTAFHAATRDSCYNISPLNVFHQTIFLEGKYDTCSARVTLQWNPYTKFKNGKVSVYEIYASVNSGSYQLLGQTTSVTWLSPVLSGNQNYRFYVRAWNEDRTVSSSSNRIDFFTYVPPAPAFVYLSSCSVLPDSTCLLRIYRDANVMAKSMDVFRSEDGITFSLVDNIPLSYSSPFLVYHDSKIKNSKGPLYYKVSLRDSCNNTRTVSNLVRTVWLKVSDVQEEMFNKKLQWTPYYGFDGFTGSYDIYRKSGNEVEYRGSTPSDTYVDNIEEIAGKGTDIYYFVIAREAMINQYGIQDSASSNLARAYATSDFFIPNAFAPKGINKVWKPVPFFVDEKEYSLRILDRWGNEVFNTQDIMQGWDGGHHPAGVYVYIIRYRTSTGEYKEKSGSIVLIR